MAHQCARVVERVETAKENGGALDLSECQLTQVPDAVFLLMKNVNIQSCNLAGNLINKIPTKLAINFSLIKELKLSNNRVSSLPTEMTNCTQLEHVDISSNSFVTLPPVLGQIPSLKTILARKNYLADVDVEIILGASNLETIDIEENPLSKKTYDEMSELSGSESRVKILLSPRTQEDWEDLSI